MSYTTQHEYTDTHSYCQEHKGLQGYSLRSTFVTHILNNCTLETLTQSDKLFHTLTTWLLKRML